MLIHCTLLFVALFNVFSTNTMSYNLQGFPIVDMRIYNQCQ